MEPGINADFFDQLKARFKEVHHVTLEIHLGAQIQGPPSYQTGRISTSKGPLFIKRRSKNPYPNMFETEALGLELLREAKGIAIPRVWLAEPEYLLLEWVDYGPSDIRTWKQLGEELAKQHRCSSSTFGLDHNNYIGTLPQNNKQCDNWGDFFVQSRLEPQLKLALDAGWLDAAMSREFDRLFARMNQLFPIESPSLLHGDLWSGNFLVSPFGQPVIIDPAVYYGHREMDLAMTLLFGGFEEAFYQSYQEHFPLETGWRERIPLANLYPLLVHVNLFGASYAGQVKAVLGQFS